MSEPTTQTATTDLDLPTRSLIAEDVRHLLDLMSIPSTQVHCEIQSDTLHILIESEEAGPLLIGSHGAHLEALQHIVRCLIRRRLTPALRVVVDVNHYRLRREQTLLALAEEAAQKTQRTGRTVVLQPMSPAERRLIHTALAPNRHVRTESLGEEPNRRVVVRPVFL